MYLRFSMQVYLYHLLPYVTVFYMRPGQGGGVGPYNPLAVSPLIELELREEKRGRPLGDAEQILSIQI